MKKVFGGSVTPLRTASPDLQGARRQRREEVQFLQGSYNQYLAKAWRQRRQRSSWRKHSNPNVGQNMTFSLSRRIFACYQRTQQSQCWLSLSLVESLHAINEHSNPNVDFLSLSSNLCMLSTNTAIPMLTFSLSSNLCMLSTNTAILMLDKMFWLFLLSNLCVLSTNEHSENPNIGQNVVTFSLVECMLSTNTARVLMLDKRTQQLLVLWYFLLHAINKVKQFACTLYGQGSYGGSILPSRSWEEGMKTPRVFWWRNMILFCVSN
jgi:hypothetical protein